MVREHLQRDVQEQRIEFGLERWNLENSIETGRCIAGLGYGDNRPAARLVAAGPLSAKLLKNGTLKTYKDFPHGMPTTQADKIKAELLAFIKG
jgi:hypothetical protein